MNMRKIKLNLDNPNQIYLIFLFLLSFYKGIILDGNIIYDVLLGIYIIFLPLKMYFQKLDKKEMFFLSFLFICILIHTIITKDRSILTSFFIVLGTKNISIKKIFSILLISKVLAFLSVILFSQIGLIPNLEVITRRGSEYVFRYSLGFNHPNTLHNFYVLIIILFLHHFYHKLKWYHLSTIFTLNEILYHFSQSRTGRYLVIASIIIILILKKEAIKNIFIQLSAYIQILLVGFIFFMNTLLYQSGIWVVIDKILNGRLFFARAILHQEISLFGKELIYYYKKFYGKFHHDNSYATTLALCGIILFSFFIIYHFITVKKLIKINVPIELIVVIVVNSLLLFTEDYFRQPFTNFTLFIMMGCFYHYKKRKDLLLT